MAALVKLNNDISKRQEGLPGMGVFSGYPGYGKTFAAQHCAAALGAVHISLLKSWTAKFFLEQLLIELNVTPKGSLAKLEQMACEKLLRTQRTVLVDEADFAVSKGYIEIIRDLHDVSAVPVILIGMEELPQRLTQWEQVDSRVAAYVQALPADLRDGQLLASVYASGIEIDKALLAHVIDRNTGSARMIAKDLDQIKKHCLLNNLKNMTRKEWGKTPFQGRSAPTVRKGLLF
ncbi:MAG: ATP-binding protein [Rhodobacteraceae bacterium]|nr:ATP-binding protein [Paracoccaceae bacterium]